MKRTFENASRLLSLVATFTTPMRDAGKIQMVCLASKSADAHYNDLQLFNEQNAILLFQRSEYESDTGQVRRRKSLVKINIVL